MRHQGDSQILLEGEVLAIPEEKMLKGEIGTTQKEEGIVLQVRRRPTTNLKNKNGAEGGI